MSAEPAPPVPVVCALILRGGRVLLARRPAGKKLGGLWEFPGGKVDAGEDAAAALHRELREELNCAVEILARLPDAAHDYGWGRIVLTPFVCRLRPDSPEPRALEHSALAWADWRALDDYELAPADVPVLASFSSRHSPSDESHHSESDGYYE